MTTRKADYTFSQENLNWLVTRFEDGQKVHESRVASEEIAEAAVQEWVAGGGPELIVE
jgi:hypothetical protein